MPQRIGFHGAAETVTGSRHLLELDGKRVLVDCGLFQGTRELKERNWNPFPVDPTDIDAVVLTHAHMDHIGYLPRLIKQGYRGPVYATYGTVGLAKISLPDSGRIQEEDARFHNRHHTARHDPALPLYTEADAYVALKRFTSLHYHQWQDLPGGATFRFIPAGHILGSAYAEIYFANGERILMSGDLGRYDRPIIQDPTAVDFAEYLVIESTYGDRLHGTRDPKDMLHQILSDAVRDRGIVMVPSFAIGRTQELLWYLHELEEEGRLPDLPIYVDSPMANAATLLYQDSDQDHDKDMKIDMAEGRSPFRSDMVKFIRDSTMSKELNRAPGPFMVISGSGMMNGGRILHHVKAHASDPANAIIFTGYQAEGTMGRRLLHGDDSVRIHREEVPIRAQIHEMDMLSAHADYGEMMRWLGGFREAPKRTFIVHGEPPAQAALKQKIEQELGWDVVIPRHGEEFDLP